MPDLLTVQARCDIVLTEILTSVTTQQTRFSGARQRFWQARYSHSIIPSHEDVLSRDRTADRLEEKPEDAVDSWRDVVPTLDIQALPCAVAVHVYDGPRGRGWILEGRFLFNTQPRVRLINNGPETERNLDWHWEDRSGAQR